MTTDASRSGHLARALRLEYATIGWKLVEGVLGVGLAWRARSAALLAFGLDGVAECASAAVLVWRFRRERSTPGRTDIAHLERRAQRFVAGSLFALAAYIMANAVHLLISREHSEPGRAAVALPLFSLAVMWWLARAKMQASAALGSPALAADAFQTRVCSWLAAITLFGMAMDSALGWWWADAVAALAMNHLLVIAALRLWRGTPGDAPPGSGGALS